MTNTRTWNLMIDVIAQAGRYTAASKTLNDFEVEGERRYWIHLAIDRFTGEVVDSQIEPVSE
jgi:pentatricopeptide repeat protein